MGKNDDDGEYVSNHSIRCPKCGEVSNDYETLMSIYEVTNVVECVECEYEFEVEMIAEYRYTSPCRLEDPNA